MEYKGIKYSIYPEFSAFVAEAYGGVGDDEVDVILRASTLTELIGYVKPENVIVDHRSLSRPPKYFVDFCTIAYSRIQRGLVQNASLSFCRNRNCSMRFETIWTGPLTPFFVHLWRKSLRLLKGSQVLKPSV
jgi:hypothetical protein